MRLVEKTFPRAFDASFARKEFAEESGAAGPVDTSETHHQSAVLPNEFLGFTKYSASRVGWFGRAFLSHPFAAGLGVNRGAAGVNEPRRLQFGEEVSRPFVIQASIILGIATAGTGAVNYELKFILGCAHCI